MRRQRALPANPTTTESERARNTVQAERLTIKQTATGYWVVERGAVQLAGGTTRRAAEAERDLLNRLRDRSVRRVSRARAASLAGSRPAAPHR